MSKALILLWVWGEKSGLLRTSVFLFLCRTISLVLKLGGEKILTNLKRTSFCGRRKESCCISLQFITAEIILLLIGFHCNNLTCYNGQHTAEPVSFEALSSSKDCETNLMIEIDWCSVSRERPYSSIVFSV